MRRWPVVCLCLQLVACRDFDEWVRLLRFTPIMAPSTKFAPGSLVRVTHKDKFDAEVICAAEGVLGEDFQPKVSSTVTVANTKQSSRTIKFNVDLASLAGGNVDIHAIKSIKAVVTNPKIYYVTDQMVMGSLLNINQRCLFALETLRGYDKEANLDITMIASVIQADASYTIDWDDKAELDINAKIVQLANLAADLHLDASRVGHQSIAAKGVYWGVKDNAYLAYLVNPDIIRKVPPNTRLIAPESTTVIRHRPDGQSQPAGAASPAVARPLPVAPPQEAAALTGEDSDAEVIDATAPNFAEQVLDWLPTPDAPPDAEPTFASEDESEQPGSQAEPSAPSEAPPERPGLAPKRSSRGSARTPPHLRGL